MNKLTTPKDINELFNYQIAKEIKGQRKLETVSPSFLGREIFNMQQALDIKDWKIIRSYGYWEKLSNIDAYCNQNHIPSKDREYMKRKTLYYRIKNYLEENPNIFAKYQKYLKENDLKA